MSLETRLTALATRVAEEVKLKASKLWVQSRGLNLVTNGSGYLGDNTNFSGATAQLADRPVGAGASFIWPSGYKVATADELIPVNPANAYEYSFAARTVVGSGNIYGLISPYDGDNQVIGPQHYMAQTDTLTTLAAPLNPGATTVTLTSAANWNNAAGANSHLRTLIFWDYVDAKGKVWPENTYSRNVYLNAYADGGISGNVITLSTPWAGPAKAAGTKLSNGSSGGSFMYLISNQPCPSTWTDFVGRTLPGTHTSGTPSAATTQLPMMTASVKVGWLLNAPSPGTGVQQAVSNVSLSRAIVATTDLNASGTKSSATFLRGDNTWAVPPDTDTTYAAITQAEAESSASTTSRLVTGQRLYQAIAKWSVLLAGTQTVTGAKTFSIPPAVAATSTAQPATDAGDGAIWYDPDEPAGTTTTDAAAITSGTLAIARLPSTVVHRVHYTAGAWPARPTGATCVEWVGPVAPAGMLSTDSFVSTA